MADTDLTIQLLANIEQMRTAFRQAANQLDHLAGATRRFNAAQTSVVQQARAVSGVQTAWRNVGQAMQEAVAAARQTQASIVPLGQHISDVGGKIQGFGQSLALGFTVPLVASGVVLETFDRKAAALQAGEAFRRTAKQFGLAGDELVQALMEASGETLTSLEAMQAASRAMILGVSGDIDDFRELMEIARDRARVMGLSVGQAFADLTLGIGRQSRLILDNLGIIVRIEEAQEKYAESLGKTVEQLTLDEQRQGFLQAVLEQTRATLDRSSLATRNASEEYQHQRARITELVESFERGILPVLNKVLGLFNALPQSIKVTSIGIIGVGLVVGPLASAFGALIRQVGNLVTIAQRLRAVVVAAATGQSLLAAATSAAAAAETVQAGAATRAAAAKTSLAAAATGAAVAEGALATTTATGLLPAIARGILTVGSFVGTLSMIGAAAAAGLTALAFLSKAVDALFEKISGLGPVFKRLAELTFFVVTPPPVKLLGFGELRSAIQGVAADVEGFLDSFLPIPRFFRGDIKLSLEESIDLFRRVEAELQPRGPTVAEVIAETRNLATGYNELTAALNNLVGAQQASAQLGATITGIVTREDLQLERRITLNDVAAAQYRLRHNLYGQQAAASTKARSVLEDERDALAHQVDVIDVAIRQRELYIESLVPPELREEIQLLEQYASVQERQANAIQRQINAVERQARAIERANRPLERQVQLLDLQIRRLELASRPARRRLEELQAIPGLSMDVVRAAQAEVAAYDAQIAQLQDTQDALRIEIETRQLEIELIRDSTFALEDELDALQDNIGATRDLVQEKQGLIDSLVPPELQREIDQLREQRGQLDLQRQTIELLIPKRDELRQPREDPFLRQIETANARLRDQQTVIDGLKRVGAIDIEMRTAMPGLAEIIILLQAAQRGFKTFQEVIGMLGRTPAAYIASRYGFNLPAFLREALPPPINLLNKPIAELQAGGLVTRPTLSLLGERGPEAVIPLNRALPGALATPNITIHVENFFGDEQAIKDIAKEVEKVIMRRLR